MMFALVRMEAIVSLLTPSRDIRLVLSRFVFNHARLISGGTPAHSSSS